MTSDTRLLDYYENELSYLRTAGQEFAKKYPKVANRLELSVDKNTDPHVERLLEAFAFLAARIHQNIDDSVSDLANNVLEQLYPHAVRPLPSVTIACFEPDMTKGSLDTGYLIKRDSKLFANVDAEAGATLHLKTTYPVTLWPLSISEVALLTDKFDSITSNADAKSVLKVSLQYPLKFALGKADLGSLRFYIKGSTEVSAQLCNLLIGNTLEVVWRGRSPDDHVIPMPNVLPRFAGMESEESLLPEMDDTHPAYRLLLEYFSYPLKFQFFDIDCSTLGKAGSANITAEPEGSSKALVLDLFIVFDNCPKKLLTVKADDIRLSCTPLINLFSMTSEPLRVTGKQTQYRLVPDIHREASTEIYSIKNISGNDSGGPAKEIPAYFSFQQAVLAPRLQQFWHARRETSFRAGMAGTDMNLTFIDTNFDPMQPLGSTLSASLLCTNRNLAHQLNVNATLYHEDTGPIAQVRVLHKPSAQLQPSLDGAARWKIVSQLSLNHLSIAEGDGALDCLKAILSLNNLSNDLAADDQIRAIKKLSCTRVTRYVTGDPWQGYRQGYRIELQLDTSGFRHSSKLIFGTVMHRFLSLFTGINTFVELAFQDPDDGSIEHVWPALPNARISL